MKARSRIPSVSLASGAALLGVAGAALLVLAARRSRRAGETDPNRNTELAQLEGTPIRRYYTGRNLNRAVSIADLRAMTHKRLPRFALEYLEGGAEDEQTLLRERRAFADWRFCPRTLVDVSHRTLEAEILGGGAPMPLIIAPTGLNGVFRGRADVELARGAAKAGVPFVQSTMSNDALEDVAKVRGVRHWWQLYVFGGDEVWRALLDRAERCGCEALVLTTNTQIFGDREWQKRTQAAPDRLSVLSALETLRHPAWLAGTVLRHGMPSFKNAVEFLPEGRRGFFASSAWIRTHQPTSLSWDTVRRIRERWKRPFLLKGLLSLEDVRQALDSGVDGVVLSTHGGRQLDWSVPALDVLSAARRLVGDRMALYMTGGIRRGTDLLKAIGLGADAVMVGRAPLYGLCAAGAAGVERALEILRREAHDALGLIGATSPLELRRGFLVRAAGGDLPLALAEGAAQPFQPEPHGLWRDRGTAPPH